MGTVVSETVVESAVVSKLCKGVVSEIRVVVSAVEAGNSVSEITDDVVIAAEAVSVETSGGVSDSVDGAVSVTVSETAKFEKSAVIFGEESAIEVILPSPSNTALSPSH